MKFFSKISLALAFLLALNLSFATEGKGEEPETTTTLKEQQEGQKPKPDEVVDNQKEPATTEESYDTVETDSTEDGSISKYNVIFYLLYKFKHSNSEDIESLL